METKAGTRHTPGPWQLIDERRNPLYRDLTPADQARYWFHTEQQHCYYISGPKSDSDFVADLIVTGQDATGNANARLIAAAPELFDACRKAHSHMRDNPRLYRTSGKNRDEWCPLFKELSEVILKATT